MIRGVLGTADYQWEQTLLLTHAAATATEKRHLKYCAFPIALYAVYIAADAAITGADTDYTSIEILDGGAAGSGTTEIANIDFALGTDAAAYAATVLTQATSPYQMDAGDHLVIQYTKVGNGLLIPGHHIILAFLPR